MAPDTITDGAFSLVAELVEANARQLNDTTNWLLDRATEERDKAVAELAAAREGVMNLLLGPWMPTQRAIELALFPNDQEIARFRQRNAD